MGNGFRRFRIGPASALSRARRPAAFVSGLKHFYLLLQPGVLVCLSTRPDATYQVVNEDDSSDCVWVRSFPLRERRLPTFGVPASQVRPIASERGR